MGMVLFATKMELVNLVQEAPLVMVEMDVMPVHEVNKFEIVKIRG